MDGIGGTASTAPGSTLTQMVSRYGAGAVVDQAESEDLVQGIAAAVGPAATLDLSPAASSLLGGRAPSPSGLSALIQGGLTAQMLAQNGSDALSLLQSPSATLTPAAIADGGRDATGPAPDPEAGPVPVPAPSPADSYALDPSAGASALGQAIDTYA